MCPETKPSPACDLAARFLLEQGDRIVRRWIEWVRERVETTTTSALPTRALENHIPPVVGSLARFIANPIEAARGDLLGHLRLHGQIRRDQGYSQMEVLLEFDGLASIITNTIQREMERHPGLATTEIAEVFTRLAAGLRSITLIVTETFREVDRERHRSVAARLEEFARAVSHDLRQPMSAISMTAVALQEHLEDDEQGLAMLQVIDQATQQVSSVLNTVRTIGIVEAAWAGDRMVPVSSAIEAILGDLAELAAERDVRMIVGDDVPPVRIETVVGYITLSNLVTNAIKYADTEKSDRWVRISARHLEEPDDSGFCEIEVADNGIGIPAELLPRVTQRSFRAHPEQAFGTGLGLYMVQQSVTERGGDLHIESVEGEGTTARARMRCLAFLPERPLPMDPDTTLTISETLRRNLPEPIEIESDEGPSDTQSV